MTNISIISKKIICSIIILYIILATISFSNCVGTVDDQNGPDIYITASPDTIIVGRGISHVVIQLYNDSIKYSKSGINVSFESNNTNIGEALNLQHYNLTDENGSASIDLIANNTIGRFKVTASCEIDGKVISNSTYINVVDWGSVSGLVLDKNGNGTGMASVTLWNVKYNESTQRWDNQDILSIMWWGTGYSSDNPVTSYYGGYATVGSFVFARIPWGTYNLTVEKEGDINNSIVTVENGTSTQIITLSNQEFDGRYGTYYFPGNISIPPSGAKNGVVWGLINDYLMFNINGVNVTLYNAKFNDTAKQWDRMGIVDIPNNPQQSRNFTPNLMGGYEFDGVPVGDYIVTAEYEYQNNYAVAHVNNNVSTTFVSILRIPPF